MDMLFWLDAKKDSSSSVKLYASAQAFWTASIARGDLEGLHCLPPYKVEPNVIFSREERLDVKI